ncbi:MAG TPA: hypothetical protein VEB21_06620 [Terriglobales bacterium]|nr:hypothetical protein [Terriglobales bacterium]
MPVETLAEATNRLTACGFDADYRVENGQLAAPGRNCSHRPGAFDVHEIVRFEGVTDPADEAILFAVECKQHAVKGTYIATYGPRTPVADEEVMKELEVRGAELPLSNQP